MNKRGKLNRFCKLHQPIGETKGEYMRMRRIRDKFLLDYRAKNNRTNKPFEAMIELDLYLLGETVDPADISVAEITNGLGLINQVLEISSQHYPNAFKLLHQLEKLAEQPRLTINQVLFSIHFLLGTADSAQATNEIKAYELRKDSRVWFTQVLFTLARFEAITILTKSGSNRKTRKDKNTKLREVIQREISRAEANGKKPNQTAIAKKLNRTKQRVGQIIKEF